jgi:Transglycosylase SLT domain
VGSGEESPSFDAVPLRRATPDRPDGAGDQAAPDKPTRAEPATAEPASFAGPAAAEPASSVESASAEPAAADTAAAEPASAGVQAATATLAPVRPRRGLRLITAAHRVASAAARSTAGWARRPHGRLAVSGLIIVALLGLTVAAGAYLVPATGPVDSPEPAGQQGPLAEQGGAGGPSANASIPNAVPSAGMAVTPSVDPSASSSAGSSAGPPGGTGGRPSDALAGWAQQMVGRMDIPQVALQAYGYAELVLAQTTPGCRLSWTTLAGIGKVESNHGSSNGATLYPDGQALPAIVGAALDGKDGRAEIRDTDAGALDNDRAWDHAVGPMQFIPSTWRTQAVDADNDNVRNPNDIDDAALAAANYLCANGRDLATPAGWTDAVAAYNIPDSYRQAVFTAANTYGTQSGV